MDSGRTTEKLCILVKAYPQPSQKYEETVCCAAVTEDGRLLRLYPIPYRTLRPEQRFNRFDWIEADIWKAEDFRPESYKVEPGSIRIIHPGKKINDIDRVRIWKPFIADSLTALKEENETTGRSLGIVRPDPGSVSFKVAPISKDSKQDREIAETLYKQTSLLNPDQLKPLEKPEYSFTYQFTSAGKKHTQKIHDWEVQAAYFNFKKSYGKKAMDRLCQEYGENIPARNLHFIMGTMLAHPRTFIIIGLLRTGVDVEMADAQGGLF